MREEEGRFLSSISLKKLANLTVFTVLVGLLALPGALLPASGASARKVDPRLLNHVSGSVVTRYFMANPGQAPAHLRARFQAARGLAGVELPANRVADPPSGDRFNDDVFGLPQNEESIAVCKGATNYVLGGTNDYRGLVDPDLNITGWHFSEDSGATLSNEGQLPAVTLSDGVTERPSGGDPVSACVVEEGGPNFYAASLNYNPDDPFGTTNAIGGYMTDLLTLQTCPAGGDSCWPTREAVAESAPGHFLDKEWMDAGDTGDGTNVWFTYSDFDITLPCCFADVKAVRCNVTLSSCTAPIKLDNDDDIQFTDVTIGPDQRTYITWAQIEGEIEGTPQTFTVKMRIGDVGCEAIGCFGPVQVVQVVTLAIPFGGFLQGNDFRVATYPKNIVKKVDGDPRIFVVWDACSERLASLNDSVCEEPKIRIRYSDDDGETWSTIKTISNGGVNYFPTIASDRSGSKFVVAWFTNDFDDDYQNAQDVEMVTMDAASFTVTKRQRVTTDGQMPNEPEADPFLGGFFIGDYIEVAAAGGNAWVAYNMNIRDVAFLFEDLPVPQQDNYVTKVST
jgi:hypothetical protein